MNHNITKVRTFFTMLYILMYTSLFSEEDNIIKDDILVLLVAGISSIPPFSCYVFVLVVPTSPLESPNTLIMSEQSLNM